MKVSLAQIVGVFVVVACTCGSALGASAPDDWRLVWADEFQQADGSAPDPAKWVHDSGAGIWGNNELQIYTDRRLNSRIEGGKLIIEARKEALAGADGVETRLHFGAAQEFGQGIVDIWSNGGTNQGAARPGHLARVLDARHQHHDR